MNIVCPNCDTRYRVKPESLGGGRSVRCANCLHRWRVGPDGRPVGPARSEPRDPFKTTTPSPPRPTGDDFDEHERGSAGRRVDTDEDHEREQALSRRRPRPGSVSARRDDDDEDGYELIEPAPLPEPVPDEERGVVQGGEREERGSALAVTFWTLLAVLVGSLTALVVFRDEVVDRLPQTAEAYSALGLPVNLDLGLEFGAFDVEAVDEGGGPVLVIRTDVYNVSGFERAVPPIKVTLFDEARNPVDENLVEAPQPSLPPDGSVRVEARLPSPPEDAISYNVEFLKAE